MPHSADTIHHALTARLSRTFGQAELRRTMHNVATDLIGATDPADLPADCRDWVERVISESAEAAANGATDLILAELATRFAAAPDDLERCDLMQAVARAQSIHVTEVR